MAGVHDPAHANEDLILGKEGANDFRDGQGAIREGSTAQTPRFVGVFGGALGGGVGGHDAGELELLGDGHEVGKIAILGVGRDFQEQGFGVGG